jgi:hypothetical protein
MLYTVVGVWLWFYCAQGSIARVGLVVARLLLNCVPFCGDKLNLLRFAQSSSKRGYDLFVCRAAKNTLLWHDSRCVWSTSGVRGMSKSFSELPSPPYPSLPGMGERGREAGVG